MPVIDDSNYLNRHQHFSDAGVYRLSDDLAVVQTLDFFTPIVDDPYMFGQIAAANSLSDIYAMGAKPLTALNISCFPSSCLSLDILAEILKGGFDKIVEAGAVLVGGHSVDDQEPKYGLSVTGIIDPARLITGSGARPGDQLILTKPLGTGIMTTAVKGEIISESDIPDVIEGMAALNSVASQVMMEVGVNACTDITGFGFLGHLYELLVSSQVGAIIEEKEIPLYQGVSDMLAMGMIPAGAYRNLEYVKDRVSFSGSSDSEHDTLITLSDPQTSGGLLVAVSKKLMSKYLEMLKESGVKAVRVGEITKDSSHQVVIV